MREPTPDERMLDPLKPFGYFCLRFAVAFTLLEALFQ